MSLELSSDLTKLLVTVSKENKTVIIDLPSFTLNRTINHDFSPLSVREHGPEIIYVTSSSDTLARIIDAKSGDVLKTFDIGFSAVLDISPSGDLLIAASTTIFSPVTLLKYSIVSDDPILVDYIDNDLGYNFAQQAVDWVNEKIYVACGWPYGISVVSLATMEKTGFLTMELYTFGVTLSPNGNIVYGVSCFPQETIYDSWATRIYAFNTSDGSLLGTYYHPTKGGAAAISNDMKFFFMGPALRTIIIGNFIAPDMPLGGSPLGYTPSLISLNVYKGIPTPRPSNVTITLDGQPLNFSFETEEKYYFSVSNPLSDGAHVVNSTLRSVEGNCYCNWSFDIDSVSGEKPFILAGSPYEGDTVGLPPEFISASINFPGPVPLGLTASISVDGTAYQTNRTSGYFFAEVPHLYAGSHDVNASITWYGGGTSHLWNFNLSPRLPDIEPWDPLNGQTVYHPLTSIVERLVSTTLEITSAEIILDDVVYPAEIAEENGIIWINLTDVLAVGEHSVTVVVYTEYGNATDSWSFTVAEQDDPDPPGPVDLERRDYHGRYSVLVPSDWTYIEDDTSSGKRIDMIFKGPISYSIQTNILFQSGYDPTVKETTAYLWESLNKSVSEVQNQGLTVSWMGEPVFINLENATGMVFNIQYSQGIQQRISMVVDEQTHNYWIIICTASSAAYSDYESTFEAIILSLRPGPTYYGQTGIVLDSGLVIILAIVIVIVTALVLVALVRARTKRRSLINGAYQNIPAPGNQVQQPLDVSQQNFCTQCGVKLLPDSAYCNNCGKPVGKDQGH
jgi:hypothetical protein